MVWLDMSFDGGWVAWISDGPPESPDAGATECYATCPFRALASACRVARESLTREVA